MKVPKMYKSSERYDAGVDVIYDDDSKLEYAPFIYATTGSGDSGGDGGDGGDDEEGEDIMVVIYDEETHAIDKSFKELKDAVEAGKIVVMKDVVLDDGTGYSVNIFYLTYLDNQNADQYYAYFTNVSSDDSEHELWVRQFDATSETDSMTLHQLG